ncbi:MAG: DUF5060 domain-containing protein [Bacteroidota bacterium]
MLHAHNCRRNHFLTTTRFLFPLLIALVLVACNNTSTGTLSGETSLTGELKKWHPITLTFDGPEAAESGTPNPFRDYRLSVTFTHAGSGASMVVPGFFAADGNAGETGAISGNKWRVHFTPHETGTWQYSASFRSGSDVAISLDENAGTATGFDGAAGSFDIAETDKTGRDHRGKGMLRYVGERYLRFDDGTYFVKAGADSPENLFGYVDFDDTYSQLAQGQEREGEVPTAPLHHYEPHLADWNEGDPSWKGGKGKALIGAINYLAAQGPNVFSFLTMNVIGDGQDVWPWISPDVHDRYDVSKLDQWEIVLSHGDSLGMFLHFKTQETENDLLLNNGDLGPERKLYYRELIARFGHHHASNWNLGEENDIWEEREDPTQTRVKSYIEYIHALDPYDHPVVIHTYPEQHEEVYRPLLGDASDLDGLSVQTMFDNVHNATLKWVKASGETSKIWVVSNDEQGRHTVGVKPDGPGSNRDDIRKLTLWGNLMAGGAGVEYYFGYEFPHTDLNSEDWRQRQTVWDDARHALTLFQDHVPFWTMQPDDALATSGNAHVLANPGEVYLVYLPAGGAASLDLAVGNYSVQWYNPRAGGDFQAGSVTSVTGGGEVSLGSAPADANMDWAVLVSKSS